jgi:hypothetical protein
MLASALRWSFWSAYATAVLLLPLVLAGCGREQCEMRMHEPRIEFRDVLGPASIALWRDGEYLCAEYGGLKSLRLDADRWLWAICSEQQAEATLGMVEPEETE